AVASRTLALESTGSHHQVRAPFGPVLVGDARNQILKARSLALVTLKQDSEAAAGILPLQFIGSLEDKASDGSRSFSFTPPTGSVPPSPPTRSPSSSPVPG